MKEKINNFIRKWRNQGIEDYGCVTSPSYKTFQTGYKRLLTQICSEIGFVLHSFNGNHYCFSAVLKNNANGNFYYVSVSDVRYASDGWYNGILYRTMKHDRDWTGGSNNYSTLQSLQENLVRLDKFSN